jgi:hypothetical protein
MVGHGVTLGLATHLRLSEESAVLVGLDHVCLAGSEGRGGELLVVVAEVDTAHERALLADDIDGLRFGSGLQESGEVVSQDASEDLGGAVSWVLVQGARGAWALTMTTVMGSRIQ